MVGVTLMAPLLAFLPLITAGVGAAVAGIELSNQPGAPKAPTQATTNTQQAQAAQAAAIAQAAALQKRRGLSSTILTSPLGTGSGPTQTATLGT